MTCVLAFLDYMSIYLTSDIALLDTISSKITKFGISILPSEIDFMNLCQIVCCAMSSTWCNDM